VLGSQDSGAFVGDQTVVSQRTASADESILNRSMMVPSSSESLLELVCFRIAEDDRAGAYSSMDTSVVIPQIAHQPSQPVTIHD
jgi:hypothetical protein